MFVCRVCACVCTCRRAGTRVSVSYAPHRCVLCTLYTSNKRQDRTCAESRVRTKSSRRSFMLLFWPSVFCRRVTSVRAVYAKWPTCPLEQVNSPTRVAISFNSLILAAEQNYHAREQNPVEDVLCCKCDTDRVFSAVLWRAYVTPTPTTTDMPPWADQQTYKGWPSRITLWSWRLMQTTAFLRVAGISQLAYLRVSIRIKCVTLCTHTHACAQARTHTHTWFFTHHVLFINSSRCVIWMVTSEFVGSQWGGNIQFRFWTKVEERD